MDTESIDEELRMLDFKLSQLKRDYDQYFLGTRPREPAMARSEVQKTIVRLTNTAIKNTGARFKFTSLCSRFQAFRRQWDDTLRKIDEGTYERHRFKARLNQGGPARAGSASQESEGGEDLYQSYVDARLACGESVKGLTREKLERVLDKQRAQLGKKLGPDAEIQFRVAVEQGKVRLKASRKSA